MGELFYRVFWVFAFVGGYLLRGNGTDRVGVGYLVLTTTTYHEGMQ